MANQGLKMKAPPHPGGFIRRQIIDGHSISVTQGATILGVTRPAFSRLLNEHADLSAEMALRIEKAFGVSMETLMRMQSAYDIALARKRERDIAVSRYVPKEMSV